ncbi:type IV secretion system protein [Neisseria sp. Ec49-e6-T10]|uniref:type IV secretion system protein n=1 Tax=Neisseria sp. Ec49-e6-T10 TaxID=3140744 RepID=UPI003EB6FC1B
MGIEDIVGIILSSLGGLFDFSFSSVDFIRFFIDGTSPTPSWNAAGSSAIADAAAMAFFVVIRKIIRDRIKSFMTGGFKRMCGFVNLIGLTVATIWVMVQGYKIITGESKASMLAFIVKAAKVFVILAVATSGSIFGKDIYDHTQSFQKYITYVVTGEEDKDVYTMVDQNLLKMQGIIAGVKALVAYQASGTSKETAEASKKLQLLSGIGMASPAVIGGTVSILNEIAMAMAVMFGPLFILSLLFEQTKNLFWNWIRYTVGVMFSMAILSVMCSIALKIVYAYGTVVGTAVLAQILDIGIGGKTIVSLDATMTQQAGLGLFLSVLILTVPPMVMQFFSANLGGAVSGYSPFTSGSKSPEQALKEGGSGGGGGGLISQEDRQAMKEMYEVMKQQNRDRASDGNAIGNVAAGKNVGAQFTTPSTSDKSIATQTGLKGVNSSTNTANT